MKVFIIFALLLSFSVSADDVVKFVITNQKVVCRNGQPTNCIKPINVTGSNIKALEIKVLSKTQAQFITYDINGKPADMGKDYNLYLKATRVPARIDADIVPAKASSIPTEKNQNKPKTN
ncbi:hypothetical protein [Halobacteriovorax marinus]|uniref:hypothetical protein n=1 Tax=Halobacteriovorax marinus TaxID=97084 RepID=UPI003A8F0105